MRVIRKTIVQTTENFNEISKFEINSNFQNDVEKGLSSIFLISQNFPATSISEFLSGENFSMTECYEETEASYHLIKYGFYKQAMISLRTSLEIGLLSIYWSILGKESVEFKYWLSSRFDTPYKNKKFWEVIRSNENIRLFDENFGLIDEIKHFGLSDFVHTKGIKYSNFGQLQRTLKGKDKFENYKEWLTNFRNIVRILEVLHLLKFPTLNIRFSTDHMLSKFGTYDNIPLFGGGLGDEMENLSSFIPKEQLTFLEELAAADEEVLNIKSEIAQMLELTPKEIEDLIILEQKTNIESSGFDNWYSSYLMYDGRITTDIVQILKDWALSNNVMTIENIMENYSKTHR